jgi:hypothetical protein
VLALFWRSNDDDDDDDRFFQWLLNGIDKSDLEAFQVQLKYGVRPNIHGAIEEALKDAKPAGYRITGLAERIRLAKEAFV